MKLYMAPIRGITNALFRNVFTECFSGFDLAVAPFVSTIQGKKISRSHIRDILPENNTGIPIVPQLMSNNGDDFIRLAQQLHDLGYDTVNWNLGCPFPMVANKKRGSGMLLYPERIDAFLSQVIPRIPVSLSIKCRLGRNQDEEILKLIPIFNRHPLKELIIHPRTGIQMYAGRVHLDRFEECTKQLKHPLVYNGDITCLEGFRKVSVRFPQIDTWMIGRGALINPFLPEILKQGKDDIPDKINRLRIFHDSLWKQYQSSMSGPSHAIDKMKGFWYYFSQAFQNKAEIYKKIKKIKSVEKFENLVWNVFHQEQLISS